MYSKIFFILILVSWFSFTHSESDLDTFLLKRLTAGRCRATCMSEFYEPTKHFRNGNNSGCTTIENWKCYMCWDYCDMLIEWEETRNQMCSDNICMEGCNSACTFYKRNESLKKVPRSGSKIFDIKLSNSLLRWNHKTTGSHNLKAVFVIFGLKTSGKWEEVDQTADKEINLKTNDYPILAIFALVPNGLLEYTVQILTADNYDYSFNVIDELEENGISDLNQHNGSSIYVEQYVIYLILLRLFNSYTCQFIISTF